MTAGKRYTDEQRREIVRIADQLGPAYATAEFDVKPATIRKWRQRLGIPFSRERIDRLAGDQQVQAMEWEVRRITLANELGEIAELAVKRVRLELGDDAARYGLRNARDASLVAATLIDKAQLLSGGATARTETEGVELKHQALELLDRLEREMQGPMP